MITQKFLRKSFWAVLFLTIFYIEAGSYFIQAARWPSLTCGAPPSRYHRVLLVADPQILGELSESAIARWDCDRFLSNTFKLALDHVQPSLVVFLGDLMDEGSVASDRQYARYYRRFVDIFRTDSLLANKTIYLPGDNDIGGENEDVTPQKLNRFNKYFGLKPDVVNFENVKFFKINFMLKTSPQYSPSFPESVENNISVALSHMSLLGASSFFTESAIRDLKPNLIISAHDHRAVHFVGDLDSGVRTLIESMSTNRERVVTESKWRFQTSKVHTNEIVVPTCSYRMGVPQYGYGALLIDSVGDNVCYSVLWLPNRLSHLKIYFYFVFPFLVLYLFVNIARKTRLFLTM